MHFAMIACIFHILWITRIVTSFAVFERIWTYLIKHVFTECSACILMHFNASWNIRSCLNIFWNIAIDAFLELLTYLSIWEGWGNRLGGLGGGQGDRLAALIDPFLQEIEYPRGAQLKLRPLVSKRALLSGGCHGPGNENCRTKGCVSESLAHGTGCTCCIFSGSQPLKEQYLRPDWATNQTDTDWSKQNNTLC